MDGVVTVVDCEALASGQFVGDLEALEAQRQSDDSLEHETPIEELFEDQLACADMLLLTKVDRVELQTQNRIRQWLQTELPNGVKIVPCKQGQISSELLLGFNAGLKTISISVPVIMTRRKTMNTTMTLIRFMSY